MNAHLGDGAVGARDLLVILTMPYFDGLGPAAATPGGAAPTLCHGDLTKDGELLGI